MARVACALERYRLRHGRFPDALSALTPYFVESLPNDLTTGRPLSYRPTEDGQFVLHSAGWNRDDAGGNWGSIRPLSGDWIWRYPAR
jgi:hypothetical protein